jgi:hypothetical protein
MEELIPRVVEKVGIDPALAEKAIGMILAFLQKEGPPEVNELVAALPGSEAAMAAAGTGGGGMMGSLMGMIGGGGIMGLGTQLMGAGLSMDQISTLGKELFAYGREHAGEDAMGAIIGGVPGLSQFV